MVLTFFLFLFLWVLNLFIFIFVLLVVLTVSTTFICCNDIIIYSLIELGVLQPKTEFMEEKTRKKSAEHTGTILPSLPSHKSVKTMLFTIVTCLRACQRFEALFTPLVTACG